MQSTAIVGLDLQKSLRVKETSKMETFNKMEIFSFNCRISSIHVDGLRISRNVE